ncbi:MAG TPA: hypothetical protein VLX92_15390 [Kofleriaceae bacterium]|nr:hypothetical protein [Kofleriaceae bacterium]
MFRENEITRVGEVLQHKQAGDLAAMVDAAAALWLEQPEHPELPDSAAAEVWKAIVDAGAVARAVDAGRRHVLEGRRLRPHAFVDVVEAIDDVGRLLELATAVLDAGWDPHPYLAAVFLTLIEIDRGNALSAFIREHRDRLSARTSSWVVVGYVFVTSNVGRPEDVGRWFERWEARAGVPSWLMEAYAAATWRRMPYRALPDLAHVVRQRCVPDATTTLFATLVALDLAARDRHDELIAAMPELVARFEAYGRMGWLYHPMVMWANAVKHRTPITLDDFGFVLVDRAASWQPRYERRPSVEERAPSWRVTRLPRELLGFILTAREILPVFAAMIGVPRGHPAAFELADRMRGLWLERLPFLVPAWHRLVAQRIG